MPYYPADFKTRSLELAQDRATRLGNGDIDRHIAQAVLQYSSHRPLNLAAEFVGNGTNDIPLPATYYDGFSRLDAVEFPIDQVPATYVDDREVYLFRKASGMFLRIETSKPTAAQTVRMFFTTYHLQGADSGPAVASTIPDADFEAVCCLAASYAAEQVAGSYASAVDPSIHADSVDGKQREGNFRELATDLKKRYEIHMGLHDSMGRGGSSVGGRGGGAPAEGIGQTFINLDSTLAGSGDAMMTHPKRWS